VGDRLQRRDLFYFLQADTIREIKFGFENSFV
jgi:hypothetical protein